MTCIDLKLLSFGQLLIGGLANEYWQNHFCPGYGLCPNAPPRRLCQALLWWQAHTDALMIRSVELHGLLTGNLPRELARHGYLFAGSQTAALSHGDPWQSFEEHIGRCELQTRLAHLRRLCQNPDRASEKLYASDPLPVDLDATVYALDSTIIDLCMSLFPWAEYKSTKSAVKLHTMLDIRGDIPEFIHISDGKLADMEALDYIQIKPGTFTVMDRGSVDFARLNRFEQAKAFFIVRAKQNLKFRPL